MYQTTIGWKQNNLGNLRGEGVAWQGKTGMQNGFSVFSERKYGLRAIYIDLIQKIKSGANTIEKIISKYAPPSENTTGAYILHVSKYSGLPSNMPLGADPLVLRKLVKAIVSHEVGYQLPDSEAQEAESLISQKKKINNSKGILGIIILISLLAFLISK